MLPSAIGQPSASARTRATSRREPFIDAPSSPIIAVSRAPVTLTRIPAGIAPRVTRPQRPHRHASDWCSVTVTATGGASKTW
jgi:hypothetical protein